MADGVIEQVPVYILNCFDDGKAEKLSLTVQLPGVESASELDVYVETNRITIRVPGRYKLDLPLELAIQDKPEFLRFVKKKQTLKAEFISLPETKGDIASSGYASESAAADKASSAASRNSRPAVHDSFFEAAMLNGGGGKKQTAPQEAQPSAHHQKQPQQHTPEPRGSGNRPASCDAGAAESKAAPGNARPAVHDSFFDDVVLPNRKRAKGSKKDVAAAAAARATAPSAASFIAAASTAAGPATAPAPAWPPPAATQEAPWSTTVKEAGKRSSVEASEAYQQPASSKEAEPPSKVNEATDSAAPSSAGGPAPSLDHSQDSLYEAAKIQANREAAEECSKRAAALVASGDLEKAIKLLVKANNLCPGRYEGQMAAAQSRLISQQAAGKQQGSQNGGAGSAAAGAGAGDSSAGASNSKGSQQEASASNGSARRSAPAPEPAAGIKHPGAGGTAAGGPEGSRGGSKGSQQQHSEAGKSSRGGSSSKGGASQAHGTSGKHGKHSKRGGHQGGAAKPEPPPAPPPREPPPGYEAGMGHRQPGANFHDHEGVPEPDPPPWFLTQIDNFFTWLLEAAKAYGRAATFFVSLLYFVCTFTLSLFIAILSSLAAVTPMFLALVWSMESAEFVARISRRSFVMKCLTAFPGIAVVGFILNLVWKLLMFCYRLVQGPIDSVVAVVAPFISAFIWEPHMLAQLAVLYSMYSISRKSKYCILKAFWHAPIMVYLCADHWWVPLSLAFYITLFFISGQGLQAATAAMLMILCMRSFSWYWAILGLIVIIMGWLRSLARMPMGADGDAGHHGAHGEEEQDSGAWWGAGVPKTKLKNEAPKGATGEVARVLRCRNYYDVLEVPRTADEDTIRKAKRTKSLATHPDKAGSDAVGAKEAFQRVTTAFEVLGDANKRRQYDADLFMAENPRSQQSYAEHPSNSYYSPQSSGGGAAPSSADYYGAPKMSMPCRACGQDHIAMATEINQSAARYCAKCDTYHAAKNGESWIELKGFFGTKKVYVCVAGVVFDITEYGRCVGLMADMHGRPVEVNSCKAPFKFATDSAGGPAKSKHAKASKKSGKRK